MVIFRTALETTPLGARTWLVTHDLVADTPFGRITVPAGFITDGASVPRAAWWLCPPFDGDYDAAAVLHDYVYRHAAGAVAAQLANRVLTRAEADALLGEGLVATGTSPFTRRVIYAAVRVGGGVAWAQGRRREQEMGAR